MYKWGEVKSLIRADMIKSSQKEWDADHNETLRKKPLKPLIKKKYSVEDVEHIIIQCNKSNSEMEILKDIVQEAGQTQSLRKLLNGGSRIKRNQMATNWIFKERF